MVKSHKGLKDAESFPKSCYIKNCSEKKTKVLQISQERIFDEVHSYLSCRLRLYWKRTTWLSYSSYLSPIQDGAFRGCSGMGGSKRPRPKIFHTYPTMMKLGTVIPYLKKIQKIYESRDTPLEFCWHQHFFTGNQQILLHQEIQI